MTTHSHSRWLPRRAFLGAVAAWPCGAVCGRAAAPAGTLQAGAAVADITLPLGTNMGGVILRNEIARSVHDPLHARALVLHDGTTPLALVVCDLRMISRDLVDRAKRQAAEALGWPSENLLVAATHTHSAPGLVGIQLGPRETWYADFVVSRIADAIRNAAARLAPAQLAYGSIAKPEHLFNRRYHLGGKTNVNPFGAATDQVIMNPPASFGELQPAGPVDPELGILSVRHADGRPLAVLANYGLHYVGGTQPGAVSADYFGAFAERLRRNLAGDDASFVGLLSNGTSGDVNNSDRRNAGVKAPPWQRMRVVAHDLADATARLCGELTYRNDVRFAVAVEDLSLRVRRPDAERLAWARDTLAKARDPQRLTRPEVYAEEALALAAGPEMLPIRLQAIRIGELGLAAAPCEVFAETGLTIKSRSPLKPTFVIELANGYGGYLPTPQQHAWGGYETWPARSSFLEVEAETKIRDRLLALLELTAGT